MKNTVIHIRSVFICAILLSGFSGTAIQAQTFKYTYQYDACGNRIKQLDAIEMAEGIMQPESGKEGNLKEAGAVDEEKYLESVDGINVLLFPNPTSTILNIQLENFDPETSGSVKIVNLDGRVVYTIEEIGGNNQLDVSTLPNGTYILQLQINAKLKTWKLIKH
jgi:hypothetical protein